MSDDASTVIEQAEESTGSTDGPEVLVDDVLVEEVSIDGMCGVY